MRLWQMAVDQPEKFAAMVERLRHLGVVKLGPLVLGSRPHEARATVPLTEEQLREKRELERQKVYDTALAASSLRPPLSPVPLNGSRLPHSVQRRLAAEAQSDGAGK